MTREWAGERATLWTISSKGIKLTTSAGAAYERASGEERSEPTAGLCAPWSSAITGKSVHGPSQSRFGLGARFNGMRRRHRGLIGRRMRAVHRLYRHMAVRPETQDQGRRIAGTQTKMSEHRNDQ